MKLRYQHNLKNSFSFSFFTGVDKSYIRQSSSNITLHEFSGETFRGKANTSASWGNSTINLSWSNLPSPKSALVLSLRYARFFFHDRNFLDVSSDEQIIILNEQRLRTTINDLGINLNFKTYHSNFLHGEAGISINSRHFTPFEQGFTSKNKFTDIDTTFSEGQFSSPEYKIHTEWELKDILGKISMKAGASLSSISVDKTNYTYVDPRAIISYDKNGWSISSSYMILHQFLHFLSNSSNGFPADLWVPSTSGVPPQRSQQTWFGISKEKNGYNFSVGVFQKRFTNLIRLKEGQSFFRPGNLSSKVITEGEGIAKGLEVLVKKDVGLTTGWIAYTLSKNDRQFTQINGGNWFPYIYDRRHELSIVMKRELEKNVSFATTWEYRSGHRLTFPGFQYEIQLDDPTDILQSYEGLSTIYDVTTINNARTRAYHKLDISFEFRKKKIKGERTWKIGIYNMYNRLNPYYHFLETDKDGSPSIKQISIFPIIPFFNFHRSW